MISVKTKEENFGARGKFAVLRCKCLRNEFYRAERFLPWPAEKCGEIVQNR
jgi:hypothetical protein